MYYDVDVMCVRGGGNTCKTCIAKYKHIKLMNIILLNNVTQYFIPVPERNTTQQQQQELNIKTASKS